MENGGENRPELAACKPRKRRRRFECVVCLSDLCELDRRSRVAHIHCCRLQQGVDKEEEREADAEESVGGLAEGEAEEAEGEAEVEGECEEEEEEPGNAGGESEAVAPPPESDGVPPAAPAAGRSEATDAMGVMLHSARRVWGKPNVFQRMMSAAAAAGGGGGADEGVLGAEEDVPPAGRGRGKGRGKGGGRGGRSGFGGGGPLQHFKFVSGTPFVVDGFGEPPREGRLYFLTHFHADHYGGLSRRWSAGLAGSSSKIVCSHITARLVARRLGVPEEKLRPLPLRTPAAVGGGGVSATVELIDANHCPGSVLLLFRLSDGRAVLHTGDFRYEPRIGAEVLSALGGRRLDLLYLDNTYCDPRHDFPPQAAVLEAVQRECRLLLDSRRTLVLFGAYTIGKERVFLLVARSLGLRLHVSAARLATLSCLDLPRADVERLTTDASATRWAVVPMGRSRVNLDRVNLGAISGRSRGDLRRSRVGTCASTASRRCCRRAMGGSLPPSRFVRPAGAPPRRRLEQAPPDGRCAPARRASSRCPTRSTPRLASCRRACGSCGPTTSSRRWAK